mmetsp:Transcript_7821/g.11301  ORF Transcript_7821/g.11301 Transcript_7821/m.11301 type:complete len:139 (-) Transcript_7821:38-454(-)
MIFIDGQQIHGLSALQELEDSDLLTTMLKRSDPNRRVVEILPDRMTLEDALEDFARMRRGSEHSDEEEESGEECEDNVSYLEEEGEEEELSEEDYELPNLGDGGYEYAPPPRKASKEAGAIVSSSSTAALPVPPDRGR